MEAGDLQVLSETGYIAKDSFNPYLGGKEGRHMPLEQHGRIQLRIYLVIIWLDLQVKHILVSLHTQYLLLQPMRAN